LELNLSSRAKAETEKGAKLKGFSTQGTASKIPLHPFSASSVRLDYQRQLEMNTQDSEEDMLFRREIRYTSRERSGGF
jgi:hypothetical protein